MSRRRRLPTDPLPAREAAVLACICAYQQERGYAPSVREIAAQVGIPSTSLMHYYLTRLERAGKITRARYVARSIVVQP